MRQRDIELVDLDAVLEGLPLEVARFQPPERSEPSVASMTIIGDFVHRRDQREAGALDQIPHRRQARSPKNLDDLRLEAAPTKETRVRDLAGVGFLRNSATTLVSSDIYAHLAIQRDHPVSGANAICTHLACTPHAG